MTLRPCVVCGQPAPAGRCTAHTLKAPTGARGYDARWNRLSRRARSLQPWCSHCGAVVDLTVDHLRWPALTLDDVQVLCRSCNSHKGAVR